MPTAKRNWRTARQLDGLSGVRSAEPHGCGARCSETRYEALCGEQEREPLHLVSRDQSDCFALLNVPLITCEAVEGIQIGQPAIAF